LKRQKQYYGQTQRKKIWQPSGKKPFYKERPAKEEPKPLHHSRRALNFRRQSCEMGKTKGRRGRT